jgi:hypothetical protein
MSLVNMLLPFLCDETACGCRAGACTREKFSTPVHVTGYRVALAKAAVDESMGRAFIITSQRFCRLSV